MNHDISHIRLVLIKRSRGGSNSIASDSIGCDQILAIRQLNLQLDSLLQRNRASGDKKKFHEKTIHMFKLGIRNLDEI